MYILHVHVKRLFVYFLSLKKSIIGSANIMQYVQKKFSCLFPISHWAAPIEMNEKKTTDATFSSIWQNRNGILLLKLFWPTVRKKCSGDREKLLKFEAESREFSKFFRSLEQFIQTVKGQNNFWLQNAFLTCSWRFLKSNRLEKL